VINEADRHSTTLSTRELKVRVPHRLLVNDLNVAFEQGSFTAILGRNGAGKTLTLHTLAGLRAASGGEVFLKDQSVLQWPRRTLARTLGLLAQTTEDAFPSTALEAVLVGRHPHIGFWEWETEEDRSVALQALAIVGLQGFEEREVATLSGGERRRVALAALLAQAPDVYLLDEPINHLDPHHQLDILHLLRRKAAEGHSVIMTLHDPALAARFADQALLLFGDGTWRFGPTQEVLTEEAMTQLYALPVHEVRWEGGRTFVMG
jgi:iron complex transport system ATP-binding protein